MMTDAAPISDSKRLQTIYAVHAILNQVESPVSDIQTLLGRLIEVVVRELGADEGTLVIFNQRLEVVYAWQADLNTPPRFLDGVIEDDLYIQAMRAHETVIIDDTRTNDRYSPSVTLEASENPRSVICVPFTNRGQLAAAALLRKAGVAQFSILDANLLTTIARQFANFAENARLYTQSQRQLRISALLQEAGQIINSTLNIDEVLQALLSQMNHLLNAEAVSIALVDQQTNELVYRVAAGHGSDKIKGLRLPSNQGISGWVMKNNEPVLVSDATADPRFNPEGDRRTGYTTRTMMCAPIAFKGQVLGTIQAVNPSGGRFTDQDLSLLINLANIASSALANAQQFERTQAAEKRYLNLFQDSIDPIVLTDVNGQIVEANRRAIAFFGYSRTELLDRSIDMLHVHEGTAAKILSIPAEGVRQFTGKVQSSYNVNVPVEVHAKRIQFGPNELLQWIYHDISEQIELEQMREDLIAMLFHDLQSPLGNVISSLSLMKDELPSDSDPSLHLMLDIAARSSSRLQTLVRSLLDITRLEAGHPVSDRREVSVQRLVQDVWEFEEPNFDRRGVFFCHEIEENVPLAYVEEDMIRRVLVNLVSNALKFSAEGDSIRVTVAHGWQDDASKILVSIADQGQGVPPEYRAAIFDKFHRVAGKASVSGLGLGLAFCRLAIEAHGGRIWVDDAPGGGARFNLTLPVAEEMPIYEAP